MKNHAIVSRAFGRQAKVFDHLYDSNPVVDYLRKKIRREVISNLQDGDCILELNAGTGTDAIFFAQKGFRVDATDISERMVERARIKIQNLGLNHMINFKTLNFEYLESLDTTYDYVYSNFGGLNCTPNLDLVLNSILEKLKPGGHATLVILPPFTFWEKMFLLKGDFKTAFRRKKRGPSVAHIEGETFNCWYYTPKDLMDRIGTCVKNESITGLCIFSPPSFMSHFPIKYPKLYRWLIGIDEVVEKLPIFKSSGDYFMISFTKI